MTTTVNTEHECDSIIVDDDFGDDYDDGDGDDNDDDDEDDDAGCVRVGWQAGGSSSFHASPQNPVLL